MFPRPDLHEIPPAVTALSREPTMQRTTSYDFDVITGPSTPPRPPQPPPSQPAPQAPRGEAAAQPAGSGQGRG